jgi:hypothetical protein
MIFNQRLNARVIRPLTNRRSAHMATCCQARDLTRDLLLAEDAEVYQALNTTGISGMTIVISVCVL